MPSLYCKFVARLSGSILCLGILLSALASASSLASLREAKSGETYYTQFSLFHDRHVHETTNYRRTVLVPINTPVIFENYDTLTGEQRERKWHPVYPQIVVKLPDGTELFVENVQKYSREDLNGIFSRTFGKNKVDLTSFTPLEKTNILEGQVAEGMSKAAVIRAMGYPPKHRTPNLSSDNWVYWSNRFGSFEVHFREDKVISVYY
jgi:hypothetical protein